jgi:hypothetical protein
VDFNEKNYCDFLFHLCAPLFKLRTPLLFYFCLDSHVIFPHLGSSCALREQFCGLPVLWFSCRTSLCLGPHCSQDRFGFVFLPLSTVRDLSSSRSCFDFFCPHLDPSPPGLSLSSLISCSSPARAEHYPDSFLP